MTTRSMRGRLSTFAFIAYVALDLSNPFIPGAFNFNPEECVEAAHARQVRESREATSEIAPTKLFRRDSDDAAPVVRRAPAPELRSVSRTPRLVTHAVSPPPPSSTEDH